MSSQRDWMTLAITPLVGGEVPRAPAVPAGLRPFHSSDAEGLARLMLDSYRGAVDDTGETLDDARRDVGRLLAGDFGHVDPGASFLVERGDAPVSATIVTRDRVVPPPLGAGEAFLAFSMTAPTWQRRGLARASLAHVIGILRARGEPRLHLVVTRSNTPAVLLYRSLGFGAGPTTG